LYEEEEILGVVSLKLVLVSDGDGGSAAASLVVAAKEGCDFLELRLLQVLLLLLRED